MYLAGMQGACTVTFKIKGGSGRDMNFGRATPETQNPFGTDLSEHYGSLSGYASRGSFNSKTDMSKIIRLDEDLLWACGA